MRIRRAVGHVGLFLLLLLPGASRAASESIAAPEVFTAIGMALLAVLWLALLQRLRPMPTEEMRKRGIDHVE